MFPRNVALTEADSCSCLVILIPISINFNRMRTKNSPVRYKMLTHLKVKLIPNLKYFQLKKKKSNSSIKSKRTVSSGRSDNCFSHIFNEIDFTTQDKKKRTFVIARLS